MHLLEAENKIREIIKGDSIAVITDSNVGPLYLKRVSELVDDAGFKVYNMEIPAGEESKNGETYLSILEFLAGIPLTRTDGVIALGGGVVGDIAGFAAATFLRGIKVIQIPTSLLAAVDSSVGGKTAINLKAGKNLAGAFHQPALVIQDPEFLKTLPEDIFTDGMAEVIKYGVLADPELFAMLKDVKAVRENPEPIVTRCVEIKKRYVEEDEFDTGVRQMLNLGHTIGHAVEKLSGFKVSHGRAVAIGMDMMAEIAERRGWCEHAAREEIREMLELWGFDLTRRYTKEEIYGIMQTDKKRKGSSIDIVVPERIGRCALKRISMEELKEIL